MDSPSGIDKVMLDISLILCCYNGKKRLRKTIEHLALQETDLQWEFILVDNASTDSSVDFVQAIWDELHPKAELRIVRETKAGLVYARKAGVRAAKGKYIIFCDDDNWLREDYLQTAYNLMEAMPNVGVLGGQSVIAPHIETPIWWDEQQGNFAVGKQLEHTGIANERGFLYGAGMVTRADLAHKIFNDNYPFLLTGRKGDVCLSGEDGEYCTRARIMGYDLYYSEDLFYWHDVDASRLNTEYLQNLLCSFDAGAEVFEKYAYVIKYGKMTIFERTKLFFIRCWNFMNATRVNRIRKKQLLYFHLYMMGLIFTSDRELDIINSFFRYAKSNTK